MRGCGATSTSSVSAMADRAARTLCFGVRRVLTRQRRHRSAGGAPTITPTRAHPPTHLLALPRSHPCTQTHTLARSLCWSVPLVAGLRGLHQGPRNDPEGWARRDRLIRRRDQAQGLLRRDQERQGGALRTFPTRCHDGIHIHGAQPSPRIHLGWVGAGACVYASVGASKKDAIEPAARQRGTPGCLRVALQTLLKPLSMHCPLPTCPRRLAPTRAPFWRHQCYYVGGAETSATGMLGMITKPLKN